MSQLYSFIRRKRRGQPAPADFLCPHCGRLAGAIVPAETVEPLPVVPLLADGLTAEPVSVLAGPLEIQKPKSSHAKNRSKSKSKS